MSIGLGIPWVLLQVLQVAAPAQSLFVSYKVIQGNEVHWNTEERAGDSLSPCIGELDASDFGQNVDAHGSNSNLIDHLLPSQCFAGDAIMIHGSTKLLERFNHTEGILR